MTEGNKVFEVLPKGWKKSFDSGKIIPTKMKFCRERDDKKMWKKGFNQINENKEFEANLNEVKRHSYNEFGHMFPYYKNNFNFFVLYHLLHNIVFFFLYYLQ